MSTPKKTQSKAAPAGVVVDHKEAGARYAVSPHNYNPKIHTRVRDLLPGESVLSFRAKRLEDLKDVVSPKPAEPATTPDTAPAEVLDTK